MKISVTYLLLFLTCHVSQAQVWNNLYGALNLTGAHPYTLDEARYVSLNEEGIIIFTTSLDSINDFNWKTKFTQINWDGEELFSKSYGNLEERWPIGWSSTGDRCSDGGYVNSGSYQIVFPEEQDLQTASPHLIRFNEQGDTLWRKTYPIYKQEGGNKVIECQDGGFAIVGTTETDTASLNTQAFVLRTDSEGNELWRKEYGDTISIDEFGIYIEEIPSGGFFLGGFWYDDPNWDGLLMKLDAEGNENWTQTYGTDFGTDYSIAINYHSSGDYILTGNRAISGDHDYSFSKARVAMMDEDGGIIWENFVGRPTAYTAFFEATETVEGDIVAFGPLGDTSNVRSAMLAKFDGATGDSLWLREYNIASPTDINAIEWIYDFTPLPDGGYSLAGRCLQTQFLGEYISDDAWVLKVDEHGCLEPGCHTVGLSEIIIGLENTMKLYPNPIKTGQALNLEFSPSPGLSMPNADKSTRLLLIDMQGRVISEKHVPAQGHNDSFSIAWNIDLPAGQYSIQWVDERRWYDALNLIVE